MIPDILLCYNELFLCVFVVEIHYTRKKTHRLCYSVEEEKMKDGTSMRETVIANAIAHPEVRVWAKLAAKYVEAELSLERKQFDLQVKQKQTRIQELEAKLASLSAKSSVNCLVPQAPEEKSSHVAEEVKSAATAVEQLRPVEQPSDVASVGQPKVVSVEQPEIVSVEEPKTVVLIWPDCPCDSSCKTLAASSSTSVGSATKSNNDDAGVLTTS
jgi:hypothetical protein